MSGERQAAILHLLICWSDGHVFLSMNEMNCVGGIQTLLQSRSHPRRYMVLMFVLSLSLDVVWERWLNRRIQISSSGVQSSVRYARSRGLRAVLWPWRRSISKQRRTSPSLMLYTYILTTIWRNMQWHVLANMINLCWLFRRGHPSLAKSCNLRTADANHKGCEKTGKAVRNLK